MEKNKIAIGIDQSYANTGISVALNNKLVAVSECRPLPAFSNTEKRDQLKEKLEKVFQLVLSKKEQYKNCDVICIIERIRLQSSRQGDDQFINFNYIKGIGALNALIVDTAHKYGIKVYSVDTRSWKAQIIGISKPQPNKYGFANEKWPTIKWCINNGYEKYIKEEVSARKKKAVIVKDGSRFTYNDNKADSIGIALYAFLPANKQKLEEEK